MHWLVIQANGKASQLLTAPIINSIKPKSKANEVSRTSGGPIKNPARESMFCQYMTCGASAIPRTSVIRYSCAIAQTALESSERSSAGFRR